MKINMKRFWALFCAMLMVLALTACNDNSQQSNNNNNNSNSNGNTDGASAYEIYTTANEKMSAVGSAFYKMDVDISVRNPTDSDNNMDMSMYGTVKQVKVAKNDFDMQYDMTTDISGQGSVDMRMYYTNGYLYYDMSDAQFKTAMAMSEAQKSIGVSPELPDITEDMISSSGVKTEGEKTVATLVVDGDKMTDYIGKYAGSLADTLEGANITMDDVYIRLTVDAEGNMVSYIMEMETDIAITESFSLGMDIYMTMDVIATGDAVTITFPEGMESWQEMSM